MKQPELNTLENAEAWLRGGSRTLLVTVARTAGSAPRPPGSMMAISADGRMAGSVSGGCIEAHLHEQRQTYLRHAVPTLCRFGQSQEERVRFQLPCRGELQLIVEPAPMADHLRSILDEVRAGHTVAREIDLGHGTVSWSPASPRDTVTWDGRRLKTLIGPQWHLILIGANDLARCVAEIGVMLGYHISVCDPREEYASAWTLHDTALVTEMPDDFILRSKVGPQTVVLGLTHDPRVDDLGLMEALRTEAFYVGALGSLRSNDRRRERLREMGLTPAEIARLKGPVGLHIGSRTPAEIAVSIFAELTACRHGIIVAPPRQEGLECPAS